MAIETVAIKRTISDPLQAPARQQLSRIQMPAEVAIPAMRFDVASKRSSPRWVMIGYACWREEAVRTESRSCCSEASRKIRLNRGIPRSSKTCRHPPQLRYTTIPTWPESGGRRAAQFEALHRQLDQLFVACEVSCRSTSLISVLCFFKRVDREPHSCSRLHCSRYERMYT